MPREIAQRFDALNGLQASVLHPKGKTLVNHFSLWRNLICSNSPPLNPNSCFLPRLELPKMKVDDIHIILTKAEIIAWHVVLGFYMLRDFIRKNR
jgi:hypothetical protein